jgi:glycosyltransferase involved in cell wall biosynthesis
MMRLRYASEWDSSGYAAAARGYLHALSLTGIDLVWQALQDTEALGRIPSATAPDAPVALRALRRPARAGDAVVLHSVPQSWAAITAAPRPGHVIGNTVWETEQVPQRWIHEMDCVDEFWVPTEWNRRTFAAAFDRPVHVVPHVLQLRESAPPPIDIPVDHHVVAIVSTWEWRKRPDRTLEAALLAFDGRTDVTIVIKTGRWPTAWPGKHTSPLEQIAAIVDRFPRAPKVLADNREWSDAQITGLLERAQCFFSLTAAEGWGLGAFDAAGAGTPVVMTGHGGQCAWLGDEHPGLVPHRLVAAEHPETTLFEPGMQWAEADIDAAIDLVRGVVDGTDHRQLARSATLTAELRERYSAPAVAQRLVDVLPEAVLESAFARLTGLPKPSD